MVERSGEEPKVIRLRGFFADPEGNLRRGVPTWTIDAEGNETPVFREHNTGMVFPRAVEETPGDETPIDNSSA